MNDKKQIAWIKSVDLEDAEGHLARLYAKVVDPQSGELDAIMQVHSLHPAGLEAHFGLYRAVMRETSGLTSCDREMIALVVSVINECHY